MLHIPCCWFDLLQFILVLAVVLFVLLCVFVKLTTAPLPVIHCYPEENKYIIGNSGIKEPFPSLDDEAECDLSVIVPAFNEEARLPAMLQECISVLERRRKLYEVIIVDDGSRDKTTEIGLQYVDKYGSYKIRVLTLEKNRGKGGAVRMGMLRSRGRRILFADADGATAFEEVAKLEEELKKITKDGQGIVCGSRAHLQDESIASRTLFRTILMYGFHFCVRVFAVKNVRDTQCGFKLLTRDSARIIFNSLHIERWAFDVEMLKLAEMLSIPVSEVPVRWTEIDGSKLNPLLDAIQMFRDIFLLWLRYAIGAWRVASIKRD